MTKKFMDVIEPDLFEVQVKKAKIAAKRQRQFKDRGIRIQKSHKIRREYWDEEYAYYQKYGEIENFLLKP